MNNDYAQVLATALRGCSRVTVTKIVMLRGSGTEDDPFREVTMLFDDEGRCLAEHDTKHPTPWYAPLKTCDEARET